MRSYFSESNHLHPRGIKPLGEEVSSKGYKSLMFLLIIIFPPLPRGGGSQELTDGEVEQSIISYKTKSIISKLGQLFLPCQGEVAVKNWLTERFFKWFSVFIWQKIFPPLPRGGGSQELTDGEVYSMLMFALF